VCIAGGLSGDQRVTYFSAKGRYEQKLLKCG
jgi:hypothetical protein